VSRYQYIITKALKLQLQIIHSLLTECFGRPVYWIFFFGGEKTFFFDIKQSESRTLDADNGLTSDPSDRQETSTNQINKISSAASNHTSNMFQLPFHESKSYS
jgi:hypothetical protein